MTFKNSKKLDVGANPTGIILNGFVNLYYTKNGCAHKCGVSLTNSAVTLSGKISQARQTIAMQGYTLKLIGGEVSVV